MANFTRAKPAGWSLNEILTSAQMNALDTDHVKAPNFQDGCSFTPSAPIYILGASGLVLGDQLHYASRSVPRAQPLVADTSNNPNWQPNDHTTVGNYLLNVTAAGLVNIVLPFLSHGNLLQDVKITYNAAAGHALDPVNGGGGGSGTGIDMPTAQLYRAPIAGGSLVSIVGPVSDPVTNRALYEAAHTWSLGGSIGHTIDLENYQYVLVINSESGTDWIAAGGVVAVVTHTDVTIQPTY